jgi:geranylgeranylglycerol-phosphate geranylgeranyltransferase
VATESNPHADPEPAARASDSLPNLLRVVHAYLVLPHAVPIIAVMTATGAFAVLAADGLPPSALFADLLLAMLGAQVAIGAVNELVDAETDARVKPAKPIPAGLVSRRGARLLTVVALAVMVGFGAKLGWASLGLCTLGTAAGIAYSVWFKRTMLAWLPYLVALPLLPNWVFTAISGFDARLLMLYPLGAFAVVGVHLSQSLPDVEADRVSGVRNLTSMLGEERAFILTLGAMLLSLVLAAVASTLWTDSAQLVVATAAMVVALIAINAGLYLWRPRAAVMACFPCVAAGTVILGLGWVLAVTR